MTELGLSPVVVAGTGLTTMTGVGEVGVPDEAGVTEVEFSEPGVTANGFSLVGVAGTGLTTTGLCEVEFTTSQGRGVGAGSTQGS